MGIRGLLSKTKKYIYIELEPIVYQEQLLLLTKDPMHKHKCYKLIVNCNQSLKVQIDHLVRFKYLFLALKILVGTLGLSKS